MVGRDRGCAVRIDSVTVSRRHAHVVVANGEAAVEDLGSKNGTQVNGQPVTERVALKDGDQIEVGSVKLTFRILDILPSTVTRPSLTGCATRRSRPSAPRPPSGRVRPERGREAVGEAVEAVVRAVGAHPASNASKSVSIASSSGPVRSRTAIG